MISENLIKRLDDARYAILGEQDKQSIGFVHSIFASCFLPYREPPKDAIAYQKKVGYASLIIKSGEIMGINGDWKKVGIPYGTKSRIIILHLCQQAIKQHSNIIQIQDSFSKFMVSCGFQVSGGKMGTISLFKEQLNRLVGCSFTLGWIDYEKVSTVYTKPITRFNLWFPKNFKQLTLEKNEITLSKEFYDHLIEHCLPYSTHAIKALRHNPRAMDLYLWASYRLVRVKESAGILIPWDTLFKQFGNEGTKSSRLFKRDFLNAIKLVLHLYEDAKIYQEIDGIRIFHSKPPIALL